MYESRILVTCRSLLVYFFKSGYSYSFIDQLCDCTVCLLFFI